MWFIMRASHRVAKKRGPRVFSNPNNMDAIARENAPSSIRRERKSRRSSILKRRPLSNLNEELKDNTCLLPSKRRVSFAPCNEMREICDDSTNLSSHVKIPAVAMPEDSQVLTGASAPHDTTAPQADHMSSQTSTPVGAKRPKRMSLECRLSIIPPDGGAPCQRDEDSAVLSLDTERLGEQEGSVIQLEADAPSDSLHRDEMSLGSTGNVPHGELLQPVLNKADVSSSMELTCQLDEISATTDMKGGTVHPDVDPSMVTEYFSAYVDRSEDLSSQSLPKRLDATAAGTGEHGTVRASALPTSHSTASGGLCDLVMHRQESLTVADMSLDLSCTSSPGQPHIHPDLVGVIGRNRNADSQERSLTRSLARDTHLSNASNMSLTCETLLLGKHGVPMGDGNTIEPEDGQDLHIHASNGTNHPALPEAPSMSLTCVSPLQSGNSSTSELACRIPAIQPLMPRDSSKYGNASNNSASHMATMADGSNREPEDAQNLQIHASTSHTALPDAPSMSLTCDSPLQGSNRAPIGGGSNTNREDGHILPTCVTSVASDVCPPNSCNLSLPCENSLLSGNGAQEKNSSNFKEPRLLEATVGAPVDQLPAAVDSSTSEPTCRIPAIQPLMPHDSSKNGNTSNNSVLQISHTMTLGDSLPTTDTDADVKGEKNTVFLQSPANGQTKTPLVAVSTLKPLVPSTSVTEPSSQPPLSSTVPLSTSVGASATHGLPKIGLTRQSKARALRPSTRMLRKRVSVPRSVTASKVPALAQVTFSASKLHSSVASLPSTSSVSPAVAPPVGADTASEAGNIEHDREGAGSSSNSEEDEVRGPEKTPSTLPGVIQQDVKEDINECTKEVTLLVEKGLSEESRGHAMVAEHPSVIDDGRGQQSHTSVEGSEHSSDQEGEHLDEQEGNHSCVQKNEHLSAQEGECSRVQESEHTCVVEEDCLRMQEEHSQMQEGEHALAAHVATPGGGRGGGGMLWEKSECDRSFKNSVTPNTLSHGRPSLAESHSVSVTSLTDFASSTNSSLAPVATKQDGVEPMCSAPVPHNALYRRLNRTYSISPDNSFSCMKEDESPEKTEDVTFNCPIPEEASPSVAGKIVHLPLGASPFHPSPCPSEGNWMQTKGIDISLVDNSVVSAITDQGQTPQVQLRPTSDDCEEEGSRVGTALVGTPPTVAPPPSAIDVEVQAITPAGPTRDMDISHGHHTSASHVSNSQVNGGTLNTTLQPTGYDSPLLQVFKTPGGATPGARLRSNISLVTTPWSAPSPFTPVLPNPSTPSVTAVGLWEHLPTWLTMANAPEFFNIDRTEIKALEKAEVLNRLAAGYREMYAVLQSEEGEQTLDTRLLQIGLNCGMEGMGHLYALMKYQERYCGKLFPWSLEDQVSSVYDPIEVRIEGGDRLHWIAKKRVEMELLADRSKALMNGTAKIYKWLIHSWTKDQFKIVFFQPMVAVTVDVSPVCELGSHMIDADISLNVRDNQLQSEKAFVLDNYRVQGSMPKVTAEVLLKIAALCKEQRSTLP